MILEALVAVGGLIVLTITYLRGRSNGYDDGYFKGHAEGVAESATLDRHPGTHTTESMVRVVRAAYRRGYLRALDDMGNHEQPDSRP